MAAVPSVSTDHSAEQALAGSAVYDFAQAVGYSRDVFERAVLFWDTLRQRADDMIAHERAGKPPLLDFDYETLLDARRFERPANYALLRITRAGDHCIEDCLDASRPPVVVVDPRAGHGPGIGGFKTDSEVGIALHRGHAVYFVSFYPEPCPGQTLADVLQALRRFVEEVARRHPGLPPVLYGNCQAGWALTLLAADCQGLSGPVVLNGSPLSYWAGAAGMNPMRLAGGFVGGVWMTHLLADLGNGRFDGAWLIQNFENLKPEGVWEKYANLFAHVDTERDRFLQFERWWNAWYFMSREEIVAIVENLFIGNRLEEGKLRIDEHCAVDLKRIRNPLVVFASYGDNITPPHQALGWIPVVYPDTNALKQADQRIVYLTNPHVGHLGIFVSAKVARFEHRAILETLADVEALAPGLYEMKIDSPTGDSDCARSQYTVRFEERQVEDLRFDVPNAAFEKVRGMSETNELFYKTFVSPVLSAMSNPWSASALEWLHPMRTSRYLLSEAFSPWMHAVAALAPLIRKERTPLPADNPFAAQEQAVIAQVTQAIEDGRKHRDEAMEWWFALVFGAMPRRLGAA
ncbi:MAG: poly(3-hydroxyalkanoate) synthetase [Lysobacterales bacterium 14-68-21]|uniref:DUF3141 domain-containing protein n=1 Tax=Pseudoxanthomonas mexicana TaxID=128785 RepID=UPI000BCE1ABF|nr:DUF3141 domain-containing protein [Pseudoxanthomonas mexicana]OZB67415.1 MAG: poly(3-hydroxyalkanoate) synthetase [Xanthomonadales bacterium 14-68-21]